MTKTRYGLIQSKFPSPYGDYGSYRRKTGQHFSSFLIGFRPLAGIMVLITKTYEVNRKTILSFRPLTGIMVLISFAESWDSNNKRLSFRPLTGIMVLITPKEKKRLHGTKTSFRPLTGIIVLIRQQAVH